MTKIYVSSCVTVADFLRLQDDGGYDSMVDMAHPNAVAISKDYQTALKAAKDAITEDLIEAEVASGEDEVDFIGEETSQGRITHIRVMAGNIPVGYIVVREMEMT